MVWGNTSKVKIRERGEGRSVLSGDGIHEIIWKAALCAANTTASLKSGLDLRLILSKGQAVMEGCSRKQ